MCGICGVLDFAATEGDEDTIRRMTATLSHRGPDSSGVHVAPPVMLGHTRLAIIDLSPTGHQPMFSEDGRVAMVYNGEVYNFPELADELRRKGHRFRGRSDSEVVLHAWLEWGEACFARLNGMFAIALWDARARTLVLARDRFGIKPLHWARDGAGRVVFGSEIKAVLAHGGVAPRLNPDFLHEYLWYGNSLWERTAFAGVERVLPSTYVVFEQDREPREERYWDVGRLPERPGSLEAHAAGVRERLDAAVRRHLIADVPVAVFLSGGIDSSAIATLAARHMQGEGAGRLRTYTAGFDEGEDLDERPQARRLAERLGTEHHELQVRVTDLPAVLEDLVRAHDEPFADAANVPLLLLGRELAARGTKVVLQGDGGDEIFAGYRRYNTLDHERFWRALARPGRAGLRLLPASPLRQRGLRFLRCFAERDPALRRALLLTVEDPAHPPTRALRPAVREALAAHDPFRAYRQAARFVEGRDPVQAMLHTDCLLLLPDTFLTKVDRPTMACSLEVRVPFLDQELTDWVVPIPARHKVRRLQKKFLLRTALRGIVPDEILDAPKRGFQVPYQRWLRGELRDYAREVLLDPSAGAASLLDRPAVEQILDAHARGERDEGFLLYKLLNLALWMRAYGVSPQLS